MSAELNKDPEFNDAIPKPRPRRGPTFAELVVLLGILATVVAFLLPSLRTPGQALWRAQCANNLKQIGLALHNYEYDHKMFPPAYTVDANGRPLHSWRTLILPYLEQEPLYRTIDLSKPWDDPANAEALATPLSVYHCPAESAGPPNTTAYLAIMASDGALVPGVPRRRAEITDASWSTLIVIEAGAKQAVPWMAPADAPESLVMGLGRDTELHHPGGMNTCRVDGAMMFLKANAPAVVRRALISIAGDDDAVAEGW